MTKEAFENAVLIHAAISGSTNAMLHLPAIAHEYGIELDCDMFDRMHRGARWLLDVRPAGRWPPPTCGMQAACRALWSACAICCIWMY